MKGWRVPLVLLLIVILLGVILFIKISNNNSNKQVVIEDVEELEEYIEKNKGKIRFSVFINKVIYIYIPLIALIAAIIGIYKLYIKLRSFKKCSYIIFYLFDNFYRFCCSQKHLWDI